MSTASIIFRSPIYPLIQEEPSLGKLEEETQVVADSLVSAAGVQDPSLPPPQSTLDKDVSRGESISPTQSTPAEKQRRVEPLQKPDYLKKAFFISPKEVQTVLQTSSKTTKALRSTVKASELCGHALIGKEAKSLLKHTQILKPMRAPYRVQKLRRHIQVFKESKSVSKKTKATASIARDAKSLAVSTAITCEFAENVGLVSHVTQWVPYLDTVIPFVKFATLGICANKMAKVYTLSSTVTSILHEIQTATDQEQKEKAVAEGLIKLQKMDPVKLQKQLGFAKEADVAGRIDHLQKQMLNPKEKAAALQSAPQVVEAVESRARIYYYLQALRAATKGTKVAGSVLNLTGVAPVTGKLMVHGATVLNFLNWAGQKLFWKGAMLPAEVKV